MAGAILRHALKDHPKVIYWLDMALAAGLVMYLVWLIYPLFRLPKHKPFGLQPPLIDETHLLRVQSGCETSEAHHNLPESFGSRWRASDALDRPEHDKDCPPRV